MYGSNKMYNLWHMIFQSNATHRVSFDKNLTSLTLESSEQPSRKNLIHWSKPGPSVILKQEESLLDFQLPIRLELLNEFSNKISLNENKQPLICLLPFQESHCRWLPPRTVSQSKPGSQQEERGEKEKSWKDFFSGWLLDVINDRSRVNGKILAVT